jgi:hypothetical protein
MFMQLPGDAAALPGNESSLRDHAMPHPHADPDKHVSPHGHPHGHSHGHGPDAYGLTQVRHLQPAGRALPAPPVLPFSLLRLSVGARLAATAGALGVLWAAVLLALR